MVVTAGAQIQIYQPTQPVLDWCKRYLVLTNPEYEKKKRMGMWLGDTPKTLTLYENHGDTLVVPYGCLSPILKRIDRRTLTHEFPLDIPEVDFGCTVPLYDYQQEALERMSKKYCGILQSPAGSGKTQIGIALAARIGRRTLWLTHTKDLLNQSKARAEQYMDKSLTGTITEGKVDIGRGITFATVQTMAMLDLEKYKHLWDCIIVDECHRVAGTPTAVTRFSRVLNALAARHKYGLSATVHRSDGLIQATYALLGGIIHQVPDEAVTGRIMRVTVRTMRTGTPRSIAYLNTDGTVMYTKLIAYLVENRERNRLIVNGLIANREHYNLILSDRLAHLRELMGMLPPELQEQAAMIDGKMTSKRGKAAREQAIEDMRSGEKRYLFATYSLAKEGLDIPRLDRLHMATPQKDYAVVTQSIGRIARTFEGKSEPVVYDYVDDIGLLEGSYKKRCTTYRKCRCRVL